MQEIDKQLICEFLEANYASFQQFLDAREIEPNEAEGILEELMKEAYPLKEVKG